MKIHTTRDKVVIDVYEIQQMVKSKILEETGREVDGDVNFQLEPGSEKQVTAYCWLVTKEGV